MTLHSALATPPALALDGISHSFGAVRALDQASLTVRPGTVHALLGENGAGKSTLMRVAFGLLQPQAGTIRRNGAQTTYRTPAAALAAGIGMVHQHFTLVPAMTVAENVALGGAGRFDPAVAAQRVKEVAERAGLPLDPEARIADLPVGAQQRCEIVKALARDVSLLILDEPTAVLAPSEAEELMRWIRGFADAGHAVVLITHKLRDALAVADDITVLHRGRTVLSARADTVNESTLADAMLGAPRERALHDGQPSVITRDAPMASVGAVVLEAKNVRYRDARGVERMRGVELTVRAGEIVGLAAVEGAGQHELLRLLAGRLTPSAGTITRPGSIGFVPEDRHRDALLLEAPLYENLALRDAVSRRGIIPWEAMRATTAELMLAFDVRASGATAIARTLSGGNQQKFVLARELAEHPAALIVENPSRGLDFRATEAVQQALRDARDAGTAVVVYSSDLDEVLLLADRVYAIFDGTVREVTGTRETIGRAMLERA